MIHIQPNPEYKTKPTTLKVTVKKRYSTLKKTLEMKGMFSDFFKEMGIKRKDYKFEVK